ncbi:MAG: serine/threonine-protein kinase [Candidatus Xenobia bacterium]
MARLPNGQQLAGRYIVDGVLGEGAMSTVYRVRDASTTGLTWALKEMRQETTSDDERIQGEALFRHEATLLARLSHPALPRVIDFFSQSNRHYLVMEHITGHTLEAIVERNGPYRESEILPIAVQLAACLRYLHEQPEGPIIFRDLKPSNVMIEVEPGHVPSPHTSPLWVQGHVKLVDFGIARLFKPGKKRDTQPLGTPGFAAPEQYGARQTTPQSDLYSLGATLHYALTAPDPDPAGGRFPLLRTLVPGASEALEVLLAECLQVEPEKRPSSSAEVLRRLQALLVPNHTQQSVPSQIDLPYLARWFKRMFSL